MSAGLADFLSILSQLLPGLPAFDRFARAAEAFNSFSVAAEKWITEADVQSAITLSILSQLLP